jgi:hypothetical protein
MMSLLRKFSNLLVHILYRRFGRKYRYFISDNFVSRLLQYRFFFQDRIVRKPYKVIEYYGEFQQELCFVLPFAYWHWKNGTLEKTISCSDTREFYFFSPQHEEKYKIRDPRFNRENFTIPNMSHTLKLDDKKWLAVPLKQQFANKTFCYDNPILVIANKYNREWNGNPINFLSLSTLEQLFQVYSNKYQIIYNRPKPNLIVTDNSEIMEFKDSELLNDYPSVINMARLYDQEKNLVHNFNHLQLMVYANCQYFISVHGGTAALASYFEGTNILYSISGVEEVFDEYSNIFSKLSKCNIVHVRSETELLQQVNDRF